MAERESELERVDEFNPDDAFQVGTDDAFQFGTDAEFGEPTGVDSPTESRGRLTSLRARLGDALSVGGVGVALVFVILGMVVFSLIPFIGMVGTFLGVGAGAFVYGLLSGQPRYLEATLAGATAAGGSVLLSYLFAVFLGSGTTMLLIGLLGGALSATAGHYFGRDLRDGLTRDIGGESSR